MKLTGIELDTSIQCRASIDTALVNEYAERMSEGDSFPPVVLFGTSARAWIGDGWHRVMAARQNGAETIVAELRPGGRSDALKHALGANALHGHRRSNADKRRCVEIALREFPKLSSRAVAKLAAVGVDMVIAHRQVSESDTSQTVTGADGKTYQAQRGPTVRDLSPQSADEPVYEETNEPDDHKPDLNGKPCMGMQFARLAIMHLRSISNQDMERAEAFRTVKEWIDEQA